MTAPAAAYASSCRPIPAPASCSTITSCPCDDELAHRRGREAHAVLEDLDLLRNADAHRKAPRLGNGVVFDHSSLPEEIPMGHADATMTQTAATRALSLDEYWMPFTPNRDFKHDPKMVVRAEGMYYWNDRGDKIIDGASGSVLRCRGPRAARDRRRGERAVARARLRRAVHARTSEAVRARHARRRAHARRPEPHLLHELGIRSRRHRDEGRARVPPGARAGRAHHVHLARARLPRRELRRNVARGPRQQPPPLRAYAARHRAHAPHAHPGKPQDARRRRARRRARGRPRALREPVRPGEHRGRASSSRSPDRPAASCRPRATSRACARSATSTASCSCSTK